MKKLVTIFRTERARRAEAKVGGCDDAAIANKPNPQTIPVILQVRRADDDVAGLNNLVGLERIGNKSVQFLRRFHHDATIAQRQHRLLLHSGVLDLLLTERRKPRPAIPMVRDSSEPRQARLLVLWVRLEVGDHFASPFRARPRRRIPTGFRPPAQGCAVRGATLGNARQTQTTPTGLCPSARRATMPQPRSGCET